MAQTKIDWWVQIRDLSITETQVANSTLTSWKLAEFIDDDTMWTATATSVSSSESIKAYVDNNIATWTEVFSEELTVTHNSPIVSALANTPTAGTQRVYLNWIRQIEGATDDYTLTGAVITFTFNLKSAWGNVDVVVVDYKF